MANILIVWEFGGGVGHLSHLYPFVEPLIKKGHDVILVTKDLGSVSLFDFPGSLKVLPCPFIKEPEQKPEIVACIASIWMRRGYGDVDKLKALINSWRAVFDLTQPDLIFFDFAPTALLAARNLDVKKVVIGSGFGELEFNKPCRVLSPWVNNIDAIAMRHEASVVDVINQCLSGENDSIKFVSDLYDVDLTLMTTIPELDHCQRNSKNTLYLRPQNNIFELREVMWANNGRPKIFVYLKSHVKTSKLIVNALFPLEFDVIFCCPGLDDRLVNKFQRQNFQVFSHPVHIAPLLQSADLIINHASKEMVTEALLAGIPQLVVPSQIEQLETSVMVEKLGIGMRLHPGSSLQQTQQFIKRLLEQPVYAIASGHISDYYAGSSKLSSYQQAVERVQALI